MNKNNWIQIKNAIYVNAQTRYIFELIKYIDFFYCTKLLGNSNDIFCEICLFDLKVVVYIKYSFSKYRSSVASLIKH